MSVTDESGHPDHGGSIWYPQGLAGKAEPRCTGCGHRVIDPRTGTSPRQTREKSPAAWATELPMREIAKRRGA